MTKEEYEQYMITSRNSIERIKTEMYDTQQQYIADNREFADGQKVEITWNGNGKKEFAYIENANTSRNGTITYNLMKAKKNGEISVRNLDTWSGNYTISEVVP